MLDRIKYMLGCTRSRIYRWLIARLIRNAVNEKNERNKIICCDFILEEDTSPQDEFELFRYLYNRKDSPFEAYYIIHERSAAYPGLKEQYGDRIIPYCAEHRIKFAFGLKNMLKTTKFICGGFQVMHALNLGITEAVKQSPYVYSFFTQHGVNFFKDNFISQSSYSAFLFDRIMISNEFEKNLFMTRGCYQEDQLVKNGLFRWDLLSADNATSEKSIFIYFTHRRYLRNMEDISDTVYVRTILGLLRDERFNKLVKDNGYTVKVAIHHTVVSVCGNDILGGIQILEDAEIADAKKNSAILITDYSSMCFEMWFQHKPVIFLNVPDSEDCLTYKHKTDLPEPYKGKEDYIFNVADTLDDCIGMLDEYFRNDFRFSETEKEKRDRFFYYNSGFCERFYEYLLSMKHSEKDLYHVPLNEYLRFAEFSDIGVEGIALPDTKGRWVISKKAAIRFHVPQTDRNIAVNLICTPYLKYKQYRVHAKFYVNGHFVQKVKFCSKRNRSVLLSIPNHWIGKDGSVEIGFRMSHVYHRRELMVEGDDFRFLSMKLLGMDIFESIPEMDDKEYADLRIEQRKLAALEAKELLEMQELQDDDAISE